MRKIVLGVMLGSAIAAPAHAERFAISCSGERINGIIGPGGAVQPDGAPAEVKDLVYVIDEEAQTVRVFVASKRRFSPVCDFENMRCTRHFGADGVRIEGEQDRNAFHQTSLFDWDRKAGRLAMVDRVTRADGTGVLIRWSLTCVPSAIPTTDA